MTEKTYKLDFNGQELIFEIGSLAEQANGSCVLRYNDTMIFVCATMSEPRKGLDFFPLSVEFQEKLYSVGRIPGSFLKRESRPSEKAVLTSRLIDRPLRPLFPKGFRNDVQIIAHPLAISHDAPPEPWSITGASLALSISDIPFAGPVAGVCIGLIDGEFIINPSEAQKEESVLELTVAGTKDAVMMVEAGAKEVPEDIMLEGIMLAHENIKKLVAFQEEIIAEVGMEKIVPVLYLPDEELDKKVCEYAYDKAVESFDTFDRAVRKERQDAIKADTIAHFSEGMEEIPEGFETDINDILYGLYKKIMRRKILDKGVRPDGRKTTEIRPLSSRAAYVPRVHGSGLFKRGQTQVLTICTLGAVKEQQLIDTVWPETSKSYIHHYNFPGYSTGEAKPIRSAGRREIGHGALAERALLPMIPPKNEFPYTIRMVSEVMSSNGSTSQASICASTLALMDAGVPIKEPVAGIAMGLIKDYDSDKVVVLTDIQGLEDFLGDMDFKVAGTKNGITAIQMDIKIKGIDEAILKEALKQALAGRTHIMANMMECISEPRTELSEFAPKTVMMQIDPDKIKDVIGSGGKVINGIIDETGVKIDIEDDGSVVIYAEDQTSSKAAVKMIENIIKEVEVGEIYTGRVVTIKDFGAFVEILPGKDGLIHISDLAYERVPTVESVLKVGDTVEVKVTEINAQGKINLSRKALLEKPEGFTEPEKRPRNNNKHNGGNYKGGKRTPSRPRRETNTYSNK